MDDLAILLAASGKAGVYHLDREPRDVAPAAERAGLDCFRIDVGHVHEKEDFLELVSKAMGFPDWFGGNWDALGDCLKDLSWLPGRGWVVVLEKSKHFAAGHRHEFDEAMDLLKEVSEYWREARRPFWVLVGGPDGWTPGLPVMPS